MSASEAGPWKLTAGYVTVARKYRAVVRRSDGSAFRLTGRNHYTPESARAEAQAWIDERVENGVIPQWRVGRGAT